MSSVLFCPLDFPPTGNCMICPSADREDMSMFRIGDFSRLTRVSMKTLRHYDEIRLFKPAYVDRFTDYRYYSFDQLPRLNRILALKGLGFPLENIRQMLDDDLSAEALQGMLRLRRVQLEQEIRTTWEKLYE